MNKNLLTMALLSSSAMMSAQSLTPELVERFAKENKIEGTERVIRNALAAGPVSNIALNQDNQTEKDTYFSHSVPSKGITDQQSSGRCWLFTGLNVMRSKMIREQELATGNKHKQWEHQRNRCEFFDILRREPVPYVLLHRIRIFAGLRIRLVVNLLICALKSAFQIIKRFIDTTADIVRSAVNQPVSARRRRRQFFSQRTFRRSTATRRPLIRSRRSRTT